MKQNNNEEIEDCLRIIYKKQLRSLLIETADKRILEAIKLAIEKGSQSKEKEMRDDEISLLEFLDDDEKSKEPLPKWAKFEIGERLIKLKGGEK